MTKLDDQLLKQIAEGSGRCYPHEAKAMAHEIMERRTAEKLAAKQQQSGLGGNVAVNVPYQYRLIPPPPKTPQGNLPLPFPPAKYDPANDARVADDEIKLTDVK